MPGTAKSCVAFKTAMEILGRPHNGLILHELRGGELRFTALAERLAIGDRMLSLRLKELEAAGLVLRQVEQGPPLRVHYALSPLGVGLGEVQDAIESWGAKLIEARAASGQPLHLESCTAAGEECGLPTVEVPAARARWDASVD
ncbi:MAG TPA: helix-turn-helix domain-containing protein [Myxococcota bacterium]|nr:helix-turn-helix domain-containing protein [Myxococcota bacterium]HNH47558.1 helix-turn-helix domain-containing protein [Myxococcota bacterium]